VYKKCKKILLLVNLLFEKIEKSQYIMVVLKEEKDMNMEPKLIIMPNIQKFGELVNEHLKVIRGDLYDRRIDIHLDRFSNAEGKATLHGDIAGKRIFVLSDMTATRKYIMDSKSYFCNGFKGKVYSRCYSTTV